MAIDIRRRDFTAALSGTTLAWPLAADRPSALDHDLAQPKRLLGDGAR
jgi:hypothetical protein